MKKYYIFTLGCQMNVSDSQRIAAKLEQLGYKSAPEREADLVVVNACSVRQKAVDRVWGKIKKWQADGKKILITGCVLPTDINKFQEKGIPFFNIKKLGKLGKILKQNSHTTKYDSFAPNESNLEYFKIKPKTKGIIAYIPIMTGCDNFCSYCAVPYTRGREKSRPMNDILSEVTQAVKNGSKEILLLGQNVNSYGIKKFRSSENYLNNNSRFIKLLKKIDNLVGDFTFNFISSNPYDMTVETVETLTELKKWPRELHLPLQSGDDEILRKMNRKYTTNQFLKLVGNLKSQIPNIKLSTDIIVGFPNETKEQFENTVKLCKKIGFTKAYIAQYSPRPGTAAAKLQDDVLPAEKKRRWNLLNNLIN